MEETVKYFFILVLFGLCGLNIWCIVALGDGPLNYVAAAIVFWSGLRLLLP